MHSFTYEGVTVTLKNPTGRDRMKLVHLRRLAGYWEMQKKDPDEASAMNEALNLLYLVDSVDGDLGFPIPTLNQTPENVNAFIQGVFLAHEDLYLEWVDALSNARQGTNDPDLKPSHEQTDDQKKIVTLEQEEKASG